MTDSSLSHRASAHDPLVAAFARALAERDPDGLLSQDLEVELVVDQVVERMLSTSAEWNDLIGPVYDTAGVMSILGVTRQAVSKRKLVALTTGSGRVVYPAFQFTGSGLVAGVATVVGLLPESLVSTWTLAVWFVTPLDALDESTPIELLADGDLPPVLLLARRWARGLAA